MVLFKINKLTTVNKFLNSLPNYFFVLAARNEVKPPPVNKKVGQKMLKPELEQKPPSHEIGIRSTLRFPAISLSLSLSFPLSLKRQPRFSVNPAAAATTTATAAIA